MNKLILFALLLFTTSNNYNLNKIENTGVSIVESEYTTHIYIERTWNNQVNLVVKLELKNDSHFISPYEPGDAKGKFYMDLGSYKDINFEGKIIESPRAIKKYGPNAFENEKAFWVTEDTTYKQPLNIISDNDFEVFGRIKFVIEPKCTLEEIPFSIVSENGVLKVVESDKC